MESVGRNTSLAISIKKARIGFCLLPVLLLAGCLGGGSGSGSDDGNDGNADSPSETPESLTAPVVSRSYDDWTLHFTWPEVSEATYYQFHEDSDGMSGFSQVGSDFTDPEYTHNVGLSERAGARYIVSACNDEGCEESDEITLDGLSSGITPIVVSGDSAPGMGGAVFSSEIGTSLDFEVNDSGAVAILGVTDQTDSSGSARDGIFKYEPGGVLTAVQLDDDNLPGSDATYNGFYGVKIANSGQIIFGGFLNLDPTISDVVNGLNNEVLLRNTAGTTELLAREGNPSSNGTLFPTIDAGDVYVTENVSTSRLFYNISVDGSGGVSFQFSSTTDAFRNSDGSVYHAPNSALFTIAGNGVITQSLNAADTILPGNLISGVFSVLRYSQNTAGQLAFGLSLANADTTLLPDSTNSGIYVRDPDGTFTQVVREQSGSSRDQIDRLQVATVGIAENGEVFYLAQRDVAGDGTRGLYTNSVEGEDFTRIARIGLPFLLDDGTVQEIDGFIGASSGFDVSNDTVSFLINAGDVSQSDALINWTNGTYVRRFMEGDDVRGLLDASGVDLNRPVTTGDAPRIRVNDNGWTGFLARAVQPNETGLFSVSPTGYTRLLVREGQTFSVNGVDYGIVFDLLDFEIDGSNRMIVSLRFDDGSNGVFSFELCSASEPC